MGYWFLCGKFRNRKNLVIWLVWNKDFETTIIHMNFKTSLFDFYIDVKKLIKIWLEFDNMYQHICHLFGLEIIVDVK